MRFVELTVSVMLIIVLGMVLLCWWTGKDEQAPRSISKASQGTFLKPRLGDNRTRCE